MVPTARGARRLLALVSLAALSSIVVVGRARAQDAPADEKVDEVRAKHALKSADKIEKEVEKLRGLKYQVPVRKGVESEAALKRHVVEETNKPENVAELAKNEKVAKAFGLIPKDFNLAKEEADLLADQIAGFYDNEGKKLRLVEKKAGFMGMDKAQMEQMDELTMAHELEHALQDQNFDLGRWFSIVDGHEDRTEAWKCVVEGEATYVSLVWMFNKQAPGMPLPDLKMMFEMNKKMADVMPGAKEQQQKLEKLPIWLVQNLTMPYEDGALFIQKVYDKGGWDAVTKLFQDPPSSTQQVLHPKKYFERVEPAEISMSAMVKVVGGKAKELDRSTMGEFNVRLLLQALGVKEKKAKHIAAGWHGDHYQAVECEDGSVALVWFSVWEDEDHASAFVDAYRPELLKLKGLDENATQTPFMLERHGAEVLLVDCADAKLRAKLATKAWACAWQDGHVKPFSRFFEKPDPKDFTEADESSGFGGTGGSGASKVALGDRVVDEALGYAARFPAGWQKQAKDTVKGVAEFSKGLWTGPNGAELRVFDFPLPFDEKTLVDQLTALAQKGGATIPKAGAQTDRTVGGHEALEVPFSGLAVDKDKREGKLVAVEREGVTLGFVLSAPEGKLADVAGVLEAVLGSVEFVPGEIKGEVIVDATHDVGSGAHAVHVRYAVAPGFDGKADIASSRHRWEKGGVSIQVVLTRATGSDLAADAQATEGDRARLLKGYHKLGSSFVERPNLGRAWVTDYEIATDSGATRRVRELVTIVGGTRVALTCSSPIESWDASRKVLERALGSFSVVDQGSVPGAEPAKPEKPAPKKDDSNEPF